MTGIEDDDKFIRAIAKKKFASLDEEVESFAAREMSNAGTDFGMWIEYSSPPIYSLHHLISAFSASPQPPPIVHIKPFWWC
jgi:hypothetical protein